MSSSPPPAPSGFPRRTLLAASAAGLAVLVSGCTSRAAQGPNTVTSAQETAFDAQVAVQKTLVAAYSAAGTADPALRAAAADLATQAGEQLTALIAAAPSATSSSAASSGASSSSAAVGANARSWLRQQVAAAATSHATACVAQSGARAALLGSIAAGLRGQDTRLA
jgi:hypothetical protein